MLSESSTEGVGGQEEPTVVIASRRYYLEQPGGELEVILSIERPVQEEPPGYFRCGYRFSGAEQVSRIAAGVDAIDALNSALEMAGSYLEHINEHKYGGKLQWDGGSAKSSLPIIHDRRSPFS